MPREILIELSEQSIDRALSQVITARGEVSKLGRGIERALCDYGVDTAVEYIDLYNAIEDGDLVESIASMPTGDGMAVVADSDHAAFVEFGTGVKGEKSPYTGGSDAFRGWQYDVNNHGEAGWFYTDNGLVRRTSGMESRPFMTNTAEAMRQAEAATAREVLGW